MKKEIRSRMVEEKYDVFVAEDGTTFNDESECAEYERNVKMQLVSKFHIEKFDGLVPLTDGMTCDGNEFYWYKVNDEDDFNTLNAYYEVIEIQAEDEDDAYEKVDTMINDGEIDLPCDGGKYDYKRELEVNELKL